MNEWESVAVPFIPAGNRRALTDEQLVDNPALADFVSRFQTSFEHDAMRHLWLFIESQNTIPETAKTQAQTSA